MSDPELPPDLAALERRLIDRPRIEPSPQLAGRVSAASRTALDRRAAGGWRPWAGAAAALLFGVNLSMSLAAQADWRLTPGPEAGRLADRLNRLRELAPDLPEPELRRQALLAGAAAGLTPAVDLTPSRERIHTTEPDRWDEH
jgi:hypothetical protein